MGRERKKEINQKEGWFSQYEKMNEKINPVLTIHLTNDHPNPIKQEHKRAIEGGIK